MADKVNIINNLSTYSKLPPKVMNEIIKREILCISSALHDAVIAKDSEAVLDIGIGSLCVELSSMQCKFVPNRELKSAIKQSIIDGVDPLVIELEATLAEKLLEICDEAI